LLAAASRADALAKLLTTLPRLSSAAATAINGAGLSFTVTPERAAAAQRRVAEDDVPTALRDRFVKLAGQFGARGRASANELLRQFLAASPAALTGRFPHAWVTRKVLRSYRREARAMRSFARPAKAKPFASY
jgi:hypothetical protein